MGLRQTFRFHHTSPDEVRVFLRGLSEVATMEDRGEFFVYSQLSGEAPFTLDCELVTEGIHSERAGEYFKNLSVNNR